MAVVQVIEVADGVSGGADVESGGRYIRSYQVEFDAINADAVAAINADDGSTAVPDYGDAYPTDSASVVTEKQADANGDNPFIWDVRVTYTVPSVNPDAPASPDPPSGGSGGTTTNIISQKKTWRLYTKTEAVLQDINGDLICNSAGDPFDPAFTREVQYPELIVERTQSSFSAQWLLDYQGKCNSAAITIGGKLWPIGSLRIVDIQAVQPAGQSGSSWQVTITIRYDPLLHDIVTLDVGLREKRNVGGADVMVPILDGAQMATQPVLLNGAGLKLAVGAAPVFLPPFEIYDVVDFTNLRLDY